jgi:hypothetical protein
MLKKRKKAIYTEGSLEINFIILVDKIKRSASKIACLFVFIYQKSVLIEISR